MPLPDIISDQVTDAAKRVGIQFTEALFYAYTLECGYGRDAENKARELDILWKRKGFQALPESLRDWVLLKCEF